MFVHNLNPVLLKLGFLEIRYYGLVYVIGFLSAYFYLRKKKKEIDMDDREIDNFMLYTMLGLIVGARIFHFIFNPSGLEDPWEFFKIWRGGMAFMGGFAGAAIAAGVYLNRIKKNFYKVADLFVLPSAFALALGRIANFMNGELVGTLTDVSWCVKFPLYSGCRHPYQLYASFSFFLLFFVLLGMRKIQIKEKLRSGFVFINFLIFFCLFRFITDFWREDTRYGGFIVGQWISIVFFIIGIVWLWKRVRVTKKNL